jgi:hypothetical protein
MSTTDAQESGVAFFVRIGRAHRWEPSRIDVPRSSVPPDYRTSAWPGDRRFGPDLRGESIVRVGHIDVYGDSQTCDVGEC